MIDTNSPDYLAGLRAGRLSFRLSLLIGGNVAIMRMDLASLSLMVQPEHVLDCGLGARLLIEDSMPYFDTYPDNG